MTSKNKLYLLKSITSDEIASTDNVDVASVMGRHKWEETQPDFEKFRMTFSSCSANEFTCSNGYCIPLSKVCDFKTDCKDYTDEYFCNTTQKRPLYYDKGLSGGKPIQVGLTAKLLRVLGIYMDDGTIKIEFEVKAEWRDSRVVFHNLHPGKKTLIPSGDISYYWQPNIILDGVVNADVSALSMVKFPGKMYVTAQKNGLPDVFDTQEGTKLGVLCLFPKHVLCKIKISWKLYY